MPDLSHDMPTPKIVVNITSAWKVLPVNMAAQSEQSSKLEILMAQATAKTPKMCPDGKLNLFYALLPHVKENIDRTSMSLENYQRQVSTKTSSFTYFFIIIFIITNQLSLYIYRLLHLLLDRFFFVCQGCFLLVL